MIAKVIIDLSVDREFDYQIPAELSDLIHIGTRVQVPFAHRHTEGYVIAIEATSEVPGLKPIYGIIGERPFLDATTVKLVRWMSRYYCARIEQCLRTVLPGAVRRKGDRFKKQRVICLNVETATTSGSDNPTEARVSEPSRRRETPEQKALLAALRDHGGEVPIARLLQLCKTTEAPIKTLIRYGQVRVETRVVSRDPLAHHQRVASAPLELMPEQQEALTCIRTALHSEAPKPILLHGVTGSGKTEVYLQGIALALEQGKGAIVLVPEIALTPQTVERFRARFGDRIAVLHSHLSEGERHDEWHRISTGDADVVIGARSAVFAPVRQPGLIIVDEEHEPSYKQSEAPRYHARDVAVMRAHLLNCPVVLGSATPSLESWVNTQKGKYTLCTLSQRADYRQMPAIRVVDMRIETERTGHANVFSRELLEAIQERLKVGEQAMLFLNRRGFSSSLVCPKCGYVSECHQCSIAHTYHRDGETLRCHLCGCQKTVPAKCPQCGDPNFRYAGFGTQRVENVMRKCFPKARIARLDADTTVRKHAYEEILGAFREGKIDILIGTQMIAKGLHFPNVTLVGIVFADLSLHVADFRAGERTFQLIVQVAGRAGRGDVRGDVFIQTYTPHHTAIQSARRLDYEGFCTEEIEFRRELDYPPAAHLICLGFRGRSEDAVKLTAEHYARALTETLASTSGIHISEATPAPLARIRNIYRYQVMIRSRSVTAATRGIKNVFRHYPLAAGVALTIDVDALDLM